MSRKMLVLDIDGTLTNSRKEITEKTLQRVIACQEAGHVVVIASGRPTPGIEPIATKIRLAQYGGYMLSFNGAKITNNATKEVVYQKNLAQELIGEMYDYSLANDLGMVTYDDASVITGTRIDSYMELEARINGIPIRREEQFVAAVNFPVCKCLLTKDGELAAEHELRLQERYGDRASIYRSEPFFIEIMPKGVDKASALEELRLVLGIERSDIIACGDGFNDISMVRYAGIGVAMQNAQPEVLEAADYVTASNDEDGVAQVIDRLILND